MWKKGGSWGSTSHPPRSLKFYMAPIYLVENGKTHRAKFKSNFWIFCPPLMPGFSVTDRSVCLSSVQSILLYKYYTVLLNLTIYRQNTYNLLTIYENKFLKLYFYTKYGQKSMIFSILLLSSNIRDHDLHRKHFPCT